MNLLCCCIIETRAILNLYEIIKHHMDKLPSYTKLIIYHSDATAYLKEKFPSAIFVQISNDFNIHNYNALLTSASFWSKFLEYHRVLIFQSDSMLLREGINEFMQWDFIGANWAWNKDYAGNGGLSLRNPKVMYEICIKYPRNSSINEDHHICMVMYEYKIGNLAPIEVAKTFSAEGTPNMGTLGYHAIRKWLSIEECEKIENQYN
jgi:hypothetical protein